MKNIEQILKEAGIEVTDEQKAAVNAAVTENYKTIAEFEKQTKKLTVAEADRDTYKDQFDPQTGRPQRKRRIWQANRFWNVTSATISKESSTSWKSHPGASEIPLCVRSWARTD